MGGHVEYLSSQPVPEGFRVYRGETGKYFFISGNGEVPPNMKGYVEIDYEERKKLLNKPKVNPMDKLKKKLESIEE